MLPIMRRVALILSAFWVACVCVQAASIFEVLDVTPTEMASSPSRPPALSLAFLPATPAERESLIDALLDPDLAEPIARRAADAALLLELQCDLEHALEILVSHNEAGIDPLHRVRLHYRLGDKDAAAALFATLAHQPIASHLPNRPPERLDHALRPWIAQGDLVAIEAFLEWLQPRCPAIEWRSAVLEQRLDLALHLHPEKSPLDSLAGESAVTRAIARRRLDPSAPPYQPAEDDVPVQDLAWLISISTGDYLDFLAPWVERAIRSGTGNPEARAELCRQIILRSGADQPRTRWLSEWMERDEEFIDLLTSPDPSHAVMRSIPYAILCQLAARHPEDVLLNLMAGINETNRQQSHQPIIVTQDALDCLKRAFEHSPLVATELDAPPETFMDWDDPARTALRQLAFRISSTELHDMLFSRQDFHALPLPRRLAYLSAANLQWPMLDAMTEIDWSDPAHDADGWVWEYFTAYDFAQMTNLGIPLSELLPKMIMGSAEKPASQVAIHSRRMLRTLFGWLSSDNVRREFLDTWHKALMERGPDFADAVLAEGPRYRTSHRPNMEHLAELLGDEAAAEEEHFHQVRESHAPKFRACAWFGPESIHGFPMGYSQRQIQDAGDRYYIKWIARGPRYPITSWLFPRYRNLARIRSDCRHARSADPIAESAAAIRSNLDPSDPAATAYAIAILTGIVDEPAPEEAQWAEEHFGEWFRARTDADFVLYRASHGISQERGTPAPNPEAIHELRALRDAAHPIRTAAADIAALVPDLEKRQKLFHELGVPYEAETPRPPRPRAPLREYGPDRPQRQIPPDLAPKLSAATDIGEIREILTAFSETYGISRFALLSEPGVLDYFASPNHGQLLDFLTIQPEPAMRTHGTNEPTRMPRHRELINLHDFFREQDSESPIATTAGKFRQLMIERGWITECGATLARDFLDAGDRKAAIDLLANTLVQLRSPVFKFAGVHRFSRREGVPQAHNVRRYLPLSLLEILADHDLILEVEREIVDTHGEVPLVTGFLRFFHNPTMEGFKTYLAEAIRENGITPENYRSRIIHLLKDIEHTRELANKILESTE